MYFLWSFCLCLQHAAAAPALRAALLEESFGGHESALLSLMAEASEGEGRLEVVAESLAGALLQNISQKVTDRFLHHMRTQVDALQSSIPDRLDASQKHLDHVLSLFYKCDAELVTALAFAERHENETAKKEEAHLKCRQEEATAKLAAESCEKAKAELARALEEDPTCKSWPSLKALTAESASCKEPRADETYEEYLERMRSEFDSQLMIYREVKNACAARENAEMSCDQDKITYIQKLQLCNVLQQHLEKESCQHAREIREAWNSYSSCFGGATKRYLVEAAQAKKMEESQLKEYQATKKIECLLGGFQSPQPKKVRERCEEEAKTMTLPPELQISIPCAPFYKLPSRGSFPPYPGHEFKKKYAGVPAEAPVIQSIQCTLDPQLLAEVKQPAGCK